MVSALKALACAIMAVSVIMVPDSHPERYSDAANTIASVVALSWIAFWTRQVWRFLEQHE